MSYDSWDILHLLISTAGSSSSAIAWPASIQYDEEPGAKTYDTNFVSPSEVEYQPNLVIQGHLRVGETTNENRDLPKDGTPIITPERCIDADVGIEEAQVLFDLDDLESPRAQSPIFSSVACGSSASSLSWVPDIEASGTQDPVWNRGHSDNR